MSIWNKESFQKDKTDDADYQETARKLRLLFEGQAEFYCVDCGSTNIRVREKK